MEEMQGIHANKMSGSATSTNQTNQMGSGSEPLIVATNTTVKLDSTSNYEQANTGEFGPLAVGTNLTIEITDSNNLLEQLGITTDGSNSYLGSNIATSDSGNSWMERQEKNPMYGGEPSVSDDEPLLVGTNITFKIVPGDDLSSGEETSALSNPTSGGNSGPLAVGTNQTLELTDSDGTLFEQFRISEAGSNDYLGNNISTGNDDGWMTRSDETPSMEGIPMGNVGNAPDNDSSYQWELGSSGESISGGSNLDQLFQASPWGTLTEVGVTSFEQVFPTVPSDVDLGSNPFAGGGTSSAGGMGGSVVT